MKIDRAIEDVEEAEAKLSKELRVAGERHAVEHDLYHLGHTLADGCSQRIERLSPFAERYGAAGHDARAQRSPGPIESLRHKGAELVGRSELSGMLLLRDLKKLYLAAQETEIDWVILAQAAQAARDGELLRVVGECHDEAQACAKWLRTRLKESSPQVLATG
jgi:hypothetical protein